MPFDREQIKIKAAGLAAKGVYIGTSSWKYQGWLGQLYTADRYTKKKAPASSVQIDLFSGTGAKPEQAKVDRERFEKGCLAEYAEVFKTVCFDGAYYKFPTREFLEGLADQVPEDFRFGFKVTEAITVKRYPFHPSQGTKAGLLKEQFLSADLFERGFLQPCAPIRKKVGVLMFEFSQFATSEYQTCADFVPDLDHFLEKLPKGWPYAIELRNNEWLKPEYFECLHRHGIAHVFNNWEAMSPVSEQMTLPGSRPNPKLVAARFLLQPGRKYAEAVKRFEPYNRVQELNPDSRAAGRALLAEGEANKDQRETFIYVNNRLEGNALETIDAMLESVTAAL